MNQKNNIDECSIKTKVEKFSFSPNDNYMNIKINQKAKPLFFNKKIKFPLFENFLKNKRKRSYFFDDTTASENEEENENLKDSVPKKKKNFFDDVNLNERKKIKIKSFLFKF